MERGQRLYRTFDLRTVRDAQVRERIRNLRDWLRKARPGEKYVYHVGPIGTIPLDLARYVTWIAEKEEVHVLHYPAEGTTILKPVYAYTVIPMSQNWRDVVHRALPIV